MKDFDANKGIWGVITVIAAVIAIIGGMLGIYSFVTGNTHLPVSTNVTQSTSTTTNATSTATISSAPSTATVLSITPTPTIEKKNTNVPSPTISYDNVSTWVWWVVFGLFATVIALMWLIPDHTPGFNEDTRTNYGVVGWILSFISALISGVFLSHVPLGFWLSMGVECVTAFVVALVGRGAIKRSRHLPQKPTEPLG